MKTPNEVKILAQKFAEKGYQLYTVGGSVRDLFLDRESHDWDFTTDATPEEILKIIPEGFYNNQFGTVGIQSSVFSNQSSDKSSNDISDDRRLMSDDEIYEITTMRKESGYTDSRHPSTVEWTTNIEEDLARRDFTINAMALSVTSSFPLVISNDSEKSQDEHGINLEISRSTRNDNTQIVDPFKGQKDLQAKIIRAVGDPNKRFNEDALRLMRAIRFATQLNFTIEEKTLEALKRNAKLINNISWERIRDEFMKILASDDPYHGVALLRDTGIFQIILPEVERCFGVKQEGPKHDRIYDIGVHSLLALKECPSKDPLIRLAALIHDVGKPDTFDTQEDGNVTFYGHDVVGAKITKKIGERFKLSRKEIEKLEKLVRWHMFTVDEHQTDAAIRRFIKNIGVENVDDMIDLRIADRLGGGTATAKSWRMQEFRKRIDQVLEKPFSISDLKINGNDVMEITGLKPGKQIGDILQKLFEEVVEDSEKNNREDLLNRINQIKG